MPSMEVYSGKPQDKDKVVHFEEWMQTTYSRLTVKIGEWLDLSEDVKARMFLGQLNTYFEERKKLLGSDESYLFPRDRPNEAALQVKLPSAYCIHYCMYVTDIRWWVVCWCASFFTNGILLIGHLIVISAWLGPIDSLSCSIWVEIIRG